MPGNLRERLTTDLHRSLAQTKALEEVVPQFGITVPHRQQHRQPWATDATSNDRLAADQRGCNNKPRQPRPTSPLRLRHEIGGKQPDPRKLGRGVGLVRFCHRGLRAAAQLGQQTRQKQASTDTNGQGAISAAAPCPQAAVARKAAPRSRQGTNTMPLAMRLSAIDPTTVAGQTSGNQASAEVTLSTDRGHPSHQLPLTRADRPQIDLAAAGQLLAEPCGGLGFLARINGSTRQGNGVRAVVIANLEE